MIVQDRMQDAVVVLADGIRLPDGQEVTVLAPSATASQTHSLLDIPTVSLGAMVVPVAAEDDLLGEMLEGCIHEWRLFHEPTTR
jgi:hypothetical protein